MTTVQRQNNQVVRRALQADGVFCTLLGGVLTLGAGAIGGLLGIEETTIVLLFGIVTFFYGIGVLFFSDPAWIDPRLPMVTVALNAILVVLFLYLLVADPFGFTDIGKWAALILADGAAILAIWQYIGLRRMR